MTTHSLLARVACLCLVGALAGCGGSKTDSNEPKASADASASSTGTGEPATQEPKSAKAAAELSAEFVTGKGPKTLAEAKGKVVIVDFWATYCGPCKKSFPKYQQLLDEFGSDLAVIAVSVDEPGDVKVDKLKDFAAKAKVSFAVVWDKEHKTAGTYNPEKMPTSFIIDKDGNIAHVHAGYEDGEENKIADEVRALIKK
ncbi:MAG: TlpA disulfide reductase family protein [Polyangiaceae bacterium]